MKGSYLSERGVEAPRVESEIAIQSIRPFQTTRMPIIIRHTIQCVQRQTDGRMDMEMQRRREKERERERETERDREE